jgi:hypothetical protein
MATITQTSATQEGNEQAATKDTRHHMKRVAFFLVAVAAVAGVVAATAPSPSGHAEEGAAPSRSAREVRGATPYVEIEKEPAPKLIVDAALPEGLANPAGAFWAQYRVENVRLLPVFGERALKASPRIGHLHISVDDLPWLWADSSDNNTVDIAGFPPGQHKVKIELVDANHNVFPGQSKTVTFTIPKNASHSH